MVISSYCISHTSTMLSFFYFTCEMFGIQLHSDCLYEVKSSFVKRTSHKLFNLLLEMEQLVMINEYVERTSYFTISRNAEDHCCLSFLIADL